jgi:hypothetical protein
MKIAYIDLNYPDFFEDYSYEPRRYGGGRIVPAPLMQMFNNFHIFSDKRSFDNVQQDKLSQCRILDWEHRKAIRDGAPVKDVIPDASNYDLFFHANTNIHLNLDNLAAQQVVWSVGWSETVNPKNIHVMFFDRFHQMPILMHGNHIIYDIVIGPKIEPFQEYQKEDMIFQCTRHEKCFQSMEVAQLALKYKIKTIFAGPMQKGYPLPDYIDNKITFYLGEISQAEKIRLNKLAKVHTQFQSWPTCATLSAKEAMSYGCFPIALPIGGWPDFIQQGVNGFIINSESEFVQAWERRNSISQRACYNTALEHGEDKMIFKIQEAFQKITGEKLT